MVIPQTVPQPKSPVAKGHHHLYLVPRRSTLRQRWVPAGRSLHVVDIENLMGGPRQGLAVLRRSSREYRELAGVGPHDHVLIACNQCLAFHVFREWPGRRLLIGHGPNGADLALLRAVPDPKWVATRFDRVVVGSGDSIFAEFVEGVAAHGIPAGVVSLPRSLAHLLARAATFVRYLHEPQSEGAAA